MKEMLKKEKGITLIALIITIIILVVLAAVSISAVTNMGIVGHAVNGAEGYAREGKKENEVLDDAITIIDDTVSKINNEEPEDEIDLETILGFISNHDVCENQHAISFTESLKFMGAYTWGTGWQEARVYRCAANNKIYIVGYKEGHDPNDVEMEVANWDGTVTLDGENVPATLSTPFGVYQKGNSSTEGQFTFSNSQLFVKPPFNGNCLLCYAEDGMVIDVQWLD